MAVSPEDELHEVVRYLSVERNHIVTRRKVIDLVFTAVTATQKVREMTRLTTQSDTGLQTIDTFLRELNAQRS